MAFGIGEALGALGAVTGLFGGRGGGSGMSREQERMLQRLYGLLGQSAPYQQSAAAGYGETDPAYRNAVREQSDYLSRDPWTDTQGAAALNQMTGGIAGDADAAAARLSAALAARGIGGDSSALAGGLAGIESGRAQALAQARSQIALRQEGERRSRLAERTDLLGGARGAYAQQGMSATSQQAGILSNLNGAYGGAYANQQAQGYAQDQQTNALVAALGGVLGSRTGQRKRRPATPPYAGMRSAPSLYTPHGY